MVQKAVRDGAPATLEVAVDNQCSVENVTRFARNAGYQVRVSDLAGDFKSRESTACSYTPPPGSWKMCPDGYF